MNRKDRFVWLAVLVAAAGLFSCSAEPVPTSPKGDPAGRALTPASAPEEEVFGDVWDAGVPVSTFKYRVTLEVHPSDDTYFQRGNRSFSTVQPVDPQGPSGHNWGWYHFLGAEGRHICSGDSLDVEVHRLELAGSLVPAQAGLKEQHCIGTGRFIVSLENIKGHVIATREIDFISALEDETPTRTLATTSPTILSISMWPAEATSRSAHRSSQYRRGRSGAFSASTPVGAQRPGTTSMIAGSSPSGTCGIPPIPMSTASS